MNMSAYISEIPPLGGAFSRAESHIWEFPEAFQEGLSFPRMTVGQQLGATSVTFPDYCGWVTDWYIFLVEERSRAQLHRVNRYRPTEGHQLMSVSAFRAALLATALLATAVFAAPAGAQSSEVECFGLTAEEAEAQGFRVQIGTPGVDVLTGGNITRDFMVGLAGDDLISGAGADDVICGGSGADVINAGDGDDRVHGGSGDDDITLGSGDDIGDGGKGADRIAGNSGDDSIRGSSGPDRISGDPGDDVIAGNDGQDVIFGGEDDDVIFGRKKADTLAGGPGNDEIFGGRGPDLISGDDGNDDVAGGRGDDRIDGDAGSDTLVGGPGDGDACDISDGDSHRNCERGFAGEDIVEEVIVEEVIEDSTPADPPSELTDVQPPAGAPVPASQAPQGTNQFGWPLLTDAGLEAMLFCESTNNHAINTGNGFFGGVQWLPATWNAAAALVPDAVQYIGTLPHLVPADIQDDVTKAWWAATRPNTQWPTCHERALEAMNVLAP